MYNTLDPKVSNKLSLVRHGWFSPEYELKDKTNSYGKLAYSWLLWRKAKAITAKARWMFTYGGPFNRTISING